MARDYDQALTRLRRGSSLEPSGELGSHSSGPTAADAGRDVGLSPRNQAGEAPGPPSEPAAPWRQPGRDADDPAGGSRASGPAADEPTGQAMDDEEPWSPRFEPGPWAPPEPVQPGSGDAPANVWPPWERRPSPSAGAGDEQAGHPCPWEPPAGSERGDDLPAAGAESGGAGWSSGETADAAEQAAPPGR